MWKWGGGSWVLRLRGGQNRQFLVIECGGEAFLKITLQFRAPLMGPMCCHVTG